MRFEDVDAKPDFVAVEERVLRRWRERDVVRRSLTSGDPDAPLLRVYDGPPTANGRPGVHHVEARVFKDVLPRYFAMKGYRVPRRAGWDCHGIPVELEIERQLGITSKPQIEEYGVAEFNRRCRQSVTGYVQEWTRLTERIGYWVDMDDPYWTMSTTYVESVWWSLKTIFDRGLLYEDYRIVPYCPRCGTTLSDHEVAQGYAQTDDLSVYAKLPLRTGPLAPGRDGVGGDPAGASLIVWTTMPWTLIFSSLAVVGEDVRYVLATGGRAGEELVVLAAERVAAVLGDGARIVRDVALAELLGARYEGPFNLVGPGSPADPDGDPASWRYVVLGDFVSTSTGSGIVSTAPAYGEDDMRVGKANGVPIINGVDAAGHLDERLGRFAGMYIRDASELVIDELRTSNRSVRTEMYNHTFPFCWRCRTPLFYYAKLGWFIATSQFRSSLLADNAEVDWRPEHIRSGRYGDWLANNVDWAVSRERYWGTPLPMWRCSPCGHLVMVGSLAELGKYTGTDMSTLDPHRPYVDEATFDCPSCATGTMRRVPEVIDAWYDSGAMPFAQYGYPHQPGSAERFAETFPADYTAEAIDQTRGWWYSLQSVSTLLFGHTSYRRALCLGHIVDSAGRKMSKSQGNVIQPNELIDTYGADALRWLFLVDGSPWQSRRVGDEGLRNVTRKLLMTVWNVYYFLVTYANLSGWTPDVGAPPVARRPVLDRYVLAELADVVSEVDESMTGFDVTSAGKRIAAFVEDLSNWYVRTTRERFWHEEPGGELAEDTRAAFATLYACVTTLGYLLAPFLPFLADELHETLRRPFVPAAADSVHLDAFPVAEPADREPGLLAVMDIARRLVTLGREARSVAGVPVRRPLRQVVVTIPNEAHTRFDEVRAVIAAELNVKEVVIATAASGHVVEYELKPNWRALGKVFGKRTPVAAAAIAAIDGATAAAELREHGVLTVTVAGEVVRLDPDSVQLIESPVSGWQVCTDGGCGVALDLAVDDGLRREGLARELARGLNDLRKRLGCEIADRVRLDVAVVADPGGDIAATLSAFGAEIATEVRASELRVAQAPRGAEVPDPVRLDLGDGAVLVVLRPHTT